MSNASYRVPVLNQSNIGKVIQSAQNERSIAYDNKKGLNSGFQGEKPSRDNYRRKESSNFTHFLSIPVKDEKIINNYEELRKDIIASKIKGVTPFGFVKSHMHHLTVLMLDLSDPLKLEFAKKTL